MKQLLILVLLILLGCVDSAWGQTTTVTGTITDAQGNAYANGTASAIKVVATGLSPGTPTTVPTSATGFFTFSGSTNALPSPASYQFTVCATPVLLGQPTVNPTPRQVCFTSGPIAISGASQDISATLNAIAPTLGPQGQGTNPTFVNPTVTGTLTVPAPSNCANSVATGLNTTLGANCTNSTGTGAWTVGGAANLNGGGTLAGTYTGNPTLSGNFTSSGTTPGAFTATRFYNEVYASTQAGATCGDKINAAATLLAGPGVINVNVTCGMGTAVAPWAAVTLPANVALRFVEQGTYFVRTIAMGAQSQLLSTIPCSLPVLGQLNCPVFIKQGNGLNASSIVSVNGTGVHITDIGIDGNVANNSTGGVNILVNLANAATITRVDSRFAPTFGLWVNSTGVANQSCCGNIFGSLFEQNNGGGTLHQNTADWHTDMTSYENNGITATVNTTATTITATSGSWSTDSSLVGTLFRVNNLLTGASNVSLTCVISALPSTTTITLGTCYNTSGVVTAMGTNTGWGLNMGCGDQWINSPTARETNHDHGGNAMDGHLIYGTAGTVLGSRAHIIGSGQFGNQFQNDITYMGDGSTAGSAAVTQGTFAGIQFLPGNAHRTPQDVWANISLIDGGAHSISGMAFAGGATPQRAGYALSVAESSSGRYFPSSVAGTNDTSNSSFGIGALHDTTSSGTFFQMGQTIYTNGGGGVGQTLALFDTLTSNCVFLRSNNGALQILNGAASGGICSTGSGFSTGTNILSVVLANDTVSGTFSPFAANSVDLGTAALPFRNLFLGTAATNNFVFTPAATAAARTVNIPDPLGTTSLPLTIASGTASMTTALIANGACGTTVTVSAVGVLATDTIDANPNGNAGTPDFLLILQRWPTAGNVNFAYCNASGASQTPTAMTVNWSVRRP